MVSPVQYTSLAVFEFKLITMIYLSVFLSLVFLARIHVMLLLDSLVCDSTTVCEYRLNSFWGVSNI